MLAKACTCAVIGLEGALVEVEVDIGHGLPAFTIVGLPDAAVNEAKERVRAAIKNSGGIFPLRRITVNLAPADLRKAGPAYDLPIAVAILMASEQVAPLSATGGVGAAEGCLFLGELSLDGGLRHTHGILPMVSLAREGERSADVRQRVRAARALQARRFAALPRLTCSADMGPKEVRQFCAVEAAAQPLLKAAAQRLQLSARAFHRVLKLARTIADLADADVIAAPHLAEALQYRPRSGVEG